MAATQRKRYKITRGEFSPEILQDYFNTLLTTADLVKMFQRSEMTISIWRDKDGLPHYIFPSEARPAIRYDRDLVEEWAEAHGKVVYPW